MASGGIPSANSPLPPALWQMVHAGSTNPCLLPGAARCWWQAGTLPSQHEAPTMSAGSFTKSSVTTNFSPALTIPPLTISRGKSLPLL